ncbi:DNA-binding transcriptional regulator, FadR family [Kosakonia oryzendophytica]|uniref:DNA-binding transcriptional regulator, FadR family n=1 Tax=Kosakonia oryzendophytica TaxID=1005665 RepID=A0A1C4AUK1_9ENTR|nr:FCD domain-containing protein [Kosakonia oryzendophytica]SCB98221.1 DNA-binding transcriptional regulator, FadR family [Kosakonia oryzendophytica]
MERPSRYLANSSTALEQLRGLIHQHESTPGTPLPTERELAESLGVGRREVRRALDVLEEEGRIWRKQGKGTFIGPAAPVAPAAIQGLVQQTNMLEVMEARLHIEPGLARLAALRASNEHLALMQRMLERINNVSPEDPDLNELWDSAFHRAIAEAAGNRLMLGLFDTLDAVRREPGWHHLRELARTPAKVDRYNDHHHRIMHAIRERQPHVAAAAMREHLLDLQHALMQAIHLGDDTP